MAEVNKVETADGEVLIDLTADTVSEEDVTEGITFHSADGVARTGTAPDKMPYISGKTPILSTDTTEAYSKETPFPYAAINSIGGKSVVDKYAEVDLGAINWAKAEESGGEIYFYSTNLASTIVPDSTPICDGYKSERTDFLHVDKNIIAAGTTLIIVDSHYNSYSGEQFKSALAGVILRYETTDTSKWKIVSAEVERIITNSANGLELQIYEIPPAIKQLDGYGWSAGSVCNEVGYANRRFIKRVTKIDLGTINWYYIPSNIFSGTVPNSEYSTNYLTNIYTFTDINTCLSTDKTFARHVGGAVYIHDSSYTDATTFKAAMSGVYLYYELETPIITDISDILADDFLIECESGGSITFESKSGLSVQNEVEYITEADFARRKANKIDVLSDVLTLTADGWTDNRQTLIFQHDTEKLNTIIVEPESLADYGAAVVYPISETYSGIVFGCTNTPTADIKIRIKSEVVRNA